ncbi:MAG: cellulase family glycosylhydrolase [Bacteroidales bacterium]
MDANGQEFIIKGINVPLAWYVSDVNNNIANIRRNTGANCLRIVVTTSTSDNDWQACVRSCINNQMIPMVELHDVTGSNDANRLNDMARFWASKKSFLTSPDIAKYILINIANEWGDWYLANSNQVAWLEAYKTAISTIRNAGIQTTLVIDAPNWGQDLRNAETIRNYARALQNHDPAHNLLFSVHMYCEWSTSGGSNVYNALNAIKSAGIPIIVGEFGWQHDNGGGSVCDIDESNIINTCQSLGVGWLAWSWKGNGGNVTYLDLSNDWAGTNLTTWGNRVVLGSNGTRTAITCSVFSSSTPNPSSTNLALNKPITVSSTESAALPGSAAVDGNMGTRWSSVYSDPQWIYVDLGANYNISQVKITWEVAYGRDYQIQVSSNATSWTTVKTVTGNTALVNDHTGLNATGRYVRIYGTARGTQWGYSIYELEVYGTLSSQSYTSVDNIDKEQEAISIYPIPFTDQITIKASETISYLVIYDLSGRVCLKSTPQTDQVTLEVNALKRGIYLVKIWAGNRIESRRVVKN